MLISVTANEFDREVYFTSHSKTSTRNRKMSAFKKKGRKDKEKTELQLKDTHEKQQTNTSYGI